MEDLNPSSNKYLHSLFSIPSANRSQDDLAEIMKYTRNSKFLKKICQDRNSDRIHWECCRVMTLEIYEPNHRIMHFGEIPDKFFIKIKGKVNIIFPIRSHKKALTINRCLSQRYKLTKTISRDDFVAENNPETEKPEAFIKKPKNFYSNIDFEILANFDISEDFEQTNTISEDNFEDLALLNSKPKPLTIESKETCYLAVISKKDFHRILCTNGAKSLEEKVVFLKALPGFSKVNNIGLQKLALSFLEVTYRKDQKIYDENDKVEYIYFVKCGEFILSQGEVVTVNKYSESKDMFLKLSNMKKLRKRVNQREVIKGKNETFGYEELVEKKEKRLRKCGCYSNFAVVYEVKIEVRNI